MIDLSWVPTSWDIRGLYPDRGSSLYVLTPQGARYYYDTTRSEWINEDGRIVNWNVANQCFVDGGVE